MGGTREESSLLVIYGGNYVIMKNYDVLLAVAFLCFCCASHQIPATSLDIVYDDNLFTFVRRSSSAFRLTGTIGLFSLAGEVHLIARKARKLQLKQKQARQIS